MADLIPKIAVVAIVFAAVWLAFQPRYVFFVRIQEGVPRLRRGQVTQAFLDHIKEACQEYSVRQAWLGGIRRGKRVALVFSRQIPPGCQQRLRNRWLLAG